nr:hypothetical protein [Lachnospiraceae bacterium]
MKRHSKIISAAICFSMVLGLFSGTQAYASAEPDAAEETGDYGEPGVIDTAQDLEALLPVGDLSIEFIEVSWEDVDTEMIHKTRNADVRSHKDSSSKYAAYTCDYFYDLMSDEYKAIYDELFDACVEVMDDTTYAYYSTAYVEVGTLEETRSFAYVFMYSNPQFYFWT